MNTNKRGDIFLLAKCGLILFIILLFQSCASTSTPVNNIVGSDFKDNLPGLWEGMWSGASGTTGKEHLNITKIDGNEVYLTGFTEGYGSVPDADEVSGSIENSTLLLTWPGSNCTEKYSMKKDDSNIFILYGTYKCGPGMVGSVQLKKNE